MHNEILQLNRRKFVAAAIAAATLPAVSFGEAPFAPPTSPRARLDFNLDWRFHKEEVTGAEAVTFDDASWAPVATPHSFNDIDSFRTIIAHGAGDRGTYKGIAWYRKHFTPPAIPSGGKLFLEFEGMRQAGDIYLNGKAIGLYENGVTPYGIDITMAILSGKPNILAVKVDNRTTYAERATGTTFQWNANDFNPDPAHAKWSGYASIYFSDSNADGRQDSSEVARVSGKVDAVRLPKQIYYAHRVIQNDHADLHLIGHWSYPEDKKVVKTVYVISNCDSVELLLNGKSLGVSSKPTSGYIHAFESVAFVPGKLKAVGRVAGKAVVDQELITVGAPAALKLTPIVGPRGLLSNGADAALIDVEIVDAAGRRCPTDDARVDFTITGPAIWRGGYNSGKIENTNNLYLNTELGINRVAIRSAATRGAITINATREGLKPARVVLNSI